MNIDLVCVGTLKERYWKDATAEYVKRLSGFGAVRVAEVKEAPLPKGASPAEEAAVIAAEGRALLGAAGERGYLIALDRTGKPLTSEEFAEKFNALAIDGISRVTFLIGGSLGLSEEALTRADLRLSFSKMTFPHQLMRVVLLEQIYRAFKINRNEPYHK